MSLGVIVCVLSRTEFTLKYQVWKDVKNNQICWLWLKVLDTAPFWALATPLKPSGEAYLANQAIASISIHPNTLSGVLANQRAHKALKMVT